MRRALILAVAALLLAAPPASAQRKPSPAAPKEAPKEAPKPPEAPPPTAAPAAYERELMRLAEVLGSLAFLRDLCRAPDAAEWPRRMQALLEAEGTAQDRRERLAGRYNLGYKSFALTYRVCTPAADLAVARYLEEGERLSRDIASRYGG